MSTMSIPVLLNDEDVMLQQIYRPDVSQPLHCDAITFPDERSVFAAVKQDLSNYRTHRAKVARFFYLFRHCPMNTYLRMYFTKTFIVPANMATDFWEYLDVVTTLFNEPEFNVSEDYKALAMKQLLERRKRWNPSINRFDQFWQAVDAACALHDYPISRWLASEIISAASSIPIVLPPLIEKAMRQGVYLALTGWDMSIFSNMHHFFRLYKADILTSPLIARNIMLVQLQFADIDTIDPDMLQPLAEGCALLHRGILKMD